jgi:surface carbohydrate biosynthesis protein
MSKRLESAKRILYIFVEVGSRELLSRLTIAEEARRRGYCVVIGEKNLLRNMCFLFRLPPGAILDKCGQMATSRPIQNLKKRGYKYVVLDEEGIFFSHPERLPEHNDVMLFNSVYQFRLARPKENAENVVGNPRLYPLSLLPYLQREVEKIRDKYGRYILICSSFDPKMKSSYAYPEEEQLDTKLRTAFLRIIKKLQSQIPIVYRPHPSDGDEFASQVSKYVPVERGNSILPWIAASQLVVNAKCTSSLEALRLGVPSATLCLKPSFHSKISALSKRFYDVETLTKYIQGGLYMNSLPKSRINYVGVIAGPEHPQKNILDAIDRIELPTHPVIPLIGLKARLMHLINQIRYGRDKCAYISIKYGTNSYQESFPEFKSRLNGRLIVSI